MENATKALLIAAAVLVAILIISLGVGIFQMGEEATSGMNLSQQEVQAFNQQFDQYHGDGRRASEVNALLKTAVQNNIKQNAEGNEPKMIEVTGDITAEVTGVMTSTPTVTDNAGVYNVVVNYNDTTGLVETIEVELQD